MYLKLQAIREGGFPKVFSVSDEIGTQIALHISHEIPPLNVNVKISPSYILHNVKLKPSQR
jgi:hypothetical protein